MNTANETITSMSESLARGLAKRVIRDVRDYKYPYLDVGHLPRRKAVREIIKFIKKERMHVYLGSEKEETSKWIFAYGGWSATAANSLEKIDLNNLFTRISSGSKISSDSEYDKLGFDVDINTPEGMKTRLIFITLSKHALERLILRKKPYMSNHREIIEYLNKIIVKVLVNCMAFFENMENGQREFSAKIDGFFYPIAFDYGINRNGNKSLAFMIKTVMPEEFESARRSDQLQGNYIVNNSISDYWPVMQKIYQQTF